MAEACEAMGVLKSFCSKKNIKKNNHGMEEVVGVLVSSAGPSRTRASRLRLQPNKRKDSPQGYEGTR